MDETLRMFNEFRSSWTLWRYKDAQFMGLVYPRADSPWMGFVEKVHRNLTHYREMNQANELMEAICRIPEFASDSDELCYYMQFRQRGILYRFQTECILEPLLKEYTAEELLDVPWSFMFQNCDYYQGYADLLREKTT